MNRNIWITTLLLLSLPDPAHAQNAGKPLTWDDCVMIALKNNPDLFSSLNARDSSKASYYGSYNGILPQLTLSNSYNDGNSFNPGSSSGGSSASGGFHWQAQGSANLNVWNMGQIAGIRSSSANLSQAEASLRLASANVRFNLLEAFAQMLFSQESSAVSKTILAMRRRSAQMVALRYDSGRESKGNMMRSNAQAIQAQADYDQALRNVRTAQKGLDRELGQDDFAAVSATGALTAQTPPGLPGNLNPILDQRPDIALQQAVILGSRAGVSQAWSTAWPNLSVNYARTRLGRVELPTDRYNWTVLGLLSYPLFGGGPTSAYFAVSAAKRNLEKAEQDMRVVRDQAIVDLESSWSTLMGAIDQVKVQTALLSAARQRNDEADIRYASGLMDYNSWEIIASDRINSERQALQARLNAVNAEAAWSKALGKGLGD